VKRRKWDALILDTLEQHQDWQGEPVDVQELIDAVIDNTTLAPQRPTVLKHIYRLVGEGKLNKSFTISLPGPVDGYAETLPADSLMCGIFRP